MTTKSIVVNEAELRVIPLSKLPDDVIQALIECRDALSQASWKVGAISNLVYDWALRARGDGFRYEVDKLTVYGLVGRIVGKSARTVRWYAETEQFWREGAAGKIREQYQDILPFSHWVFARRFGDRAPEVIERSATLAEEQGYAPSVERLEAEFIEVLKGIERAEQAQAFFNPPGREVGEGEDGAVVDVGQALIGLVEEGIADIRGSQGLTVSAMESIINPPPGGGGPESLAVSADVRRAAAEQIEQAGLILGHAREVLVADRAFIKARRAAGLEREVTEIARRVQGLAKWVKRIA